MALVLGTNCGFVTTAPTTDPEGFTTVLVGENSHVTRDTTPSGNIKVTEVGWWATTSTGTADFDIGIYAADGSVVPGEAGTLIEVARNNVKSTGIGWKTVSVDWDISGDTDYWIGMQFDDAGNQRTDKKSFGGPANSGTDIIEGSQTSLPNPFGGGAFSDETIFSFYALIEVAVTGTNLQINIADAWKEVPAVQINIGDVWKEVVGMQLNIGDTWKSIF